MHIFNIFQYPHIFEPHEYTLLLTNISALQSDLRQLYNQALDESHHGHPVVVEHIQTGSRGRPAIHINEDFLRWAYRLRTTSAISRFLGVSRGTVRNALLIYGIAEPKASPFITSGSPPPSSFPGLDGFEFNNHHDDPGVIQTADNLLPSFDTAALDTEDPILNPIHNFPASSTLAGISVPQITSYTGPLSIIADADLDVIIRMLRHHYSRAGITMLHGLLRALGYHIPRSRIRESLLRIDPVQRVFERIRIRRRVYSVPGPNSLWHHDGQHGI